MAAPNAKPTSTPEWASTASTVSPWAASTAYVAADLATNGGNVYEVVTGGTSAGSGGPTGTGTAITDNTVTWRYLGKAGTAGGITEPSPGRKQTGWLAGEKPPHGYFNWWQELTYRWTRFLDTFNQYLQIWQNAAVFEGPPAWASSTAYVVGEYVLNDGKVYVCTVAGTSAGSGGPTGTGTGIVDGDAEWDYASLPFDVEVPAQFQEAVTLQAISHARSIVYDQGAGNDEPLIEAPAIVITGGVGYRRIVEDPTTGIRFFIGRNGGVSEFVLSLGAEWRDTPSPGWYGDPGTTGTFVVLSESVLTVYRGSGAGLFTLDTRININLATGSIAQAFNNTGGTPGNATHYGPIGRAALASGATSVTITNGRCTTNSTVAFSIEGASFDATATRFQVAVASGSFTLHANAAATGTVVFRYAIHADNGVTAS